MNQLTSKQIIIFLRDNFKFVQKPFSYIFNDFADGFELGVFNKIWFLKLDKELCTQCKNWKYHIFQCV